MRFDPGGSEEPQINLAPLIDVVFLLLIFFVVTSTFVHGAGLRIHLPKAGDAQALTHRGHIELAIDAAGDYFVDGHRVRKATPQGLRQALYAVAGGRHDQPVVIRADGRSSHQSVVTALDVAGAMGFKHLAIATRAPAPSKGLSSGHE